MDFDGLYKEIKNEKELYNDLKKEAIIFCKKKEFNILKPHDISIKINSICYNACNFCSNPANGTYLDLNLALPYIKNARVLQLTGGEPFLHPENNLEEFLEKFIEYNGTDCIIGVMTSGINPEAPKEMIERFYNNFSMLANLSKRTRCLSLFFSYSEGLNLDARLSDFFSYYKKIMKNKNILLDFRILLGNENELTFKTSKLKKLTEGIPCEIEYSLITTKEMVNNHCVNEECNLIGKELMIENKGYFSPCCSVFNDFKPLPIIASLGEPLETVLDKRIIYYGLLSNFEKFMQEKRNEELSCLICTNFFDKYLTKVYDKIMQSKA